MIDLAKNIRCWRNLAVQVELKLLMTQIQMPNVGLENANEKEHSVEIKHENQTDDHEQNRIALTIEEAIAKS